MMLLKLLNQQILNFYEYFHYFGSNFFLKDGRSGQTQ